MILVSYNGINFVDYDGTGYDVWIGDGSGHALPSVQAQLSPRIGAWPVMSGLARPGHRFTMFVYILGDDLPALRTAMFQLFNPEDETPKRLVATDDDGGRERYLMCLCESLQPAKDGGGFSERLFVATMVVDGDVRWRSVSTETVTWLVTVDGDTETVSNPGDDEAYPVLTIEPTAPKLLYGNRTGRWAAIHWKATSGAVDYPIRLGALDTASLVKTATATTLDGAIVAGDTSITLTDASSFDTAGMAYITDAVGGDEQIAWSGKIGNELTGVTRGIGGTSAAGHSGGQAIAVSKMLANGNDLRVWVDGVEEDRWLVDFNTANTYIWINMSFSATVSLTLATGFADVDDVTTITVNEDISTMPSTGLLMIGTEVFAYSGTTPGTFQFTGVIRAVRGTTAATHLAAASVLWIQHDVWLSYSDAEASAPSTDDDYKPVIEETSTNDAWTYVNFGDDAGLRTGAWTQLAGMTAPTFYTANRETNADPWEEIGITGIGAWQQGRWYLENVCQIAQVSFTNGEKRITDLAEWAAEAIQSYSGGVWTPEYLIPAPSVVDTWEAWSRTETLYAGATRVGLLVANAGGYSSTKNLEAADCTVTFNTTYTPDVSFPGSETTGLYALVITITNNTTEQSISLLYNMELGQELEVDTNAKTVTDLVDNSKQRQALTLGGRPRRHWLKLLPGDNELEWTEADTSGVTATIEFEARYYD